MKRSGALWMIAGTLAGGALVVAAAIAVEAGGGSVPCCTRAVVAEGAAIDVLNTVGPDGHPAIRLPLERAMESSGRGCGWEGEEYACAED